MEFINSSALLVLAKTLFLTDTCEGQGIFQLVGLYSSDLEPGGTLPTQNVYKCWEHVGFLLLALMPLGDICTSPTS